MSDPIKHECGIAVVRLLKPISYYAEKYGRPLYGFQKLFLLMEKQHNRGQDGVGIACTKLKMPLGQPYMFRARSADAESLSAVFNAQMENFDLMVRSGIIQPEIGASIKQNFDYGGEVLLGHLRYGTSGLFSLNSCHPYIRRSNWPTKTLSVVGNFNMTNTPELNRIMIERGQHPVFDTDTQTVLEEIGYHLDEEHARIYRQEREAGLAGEEIPLRISRQLDPAQIIRESARAWDGGYTIAGMIGNGDAFIFRDPNGIRPCFYYHDDELIAFASERVPLMTVFDAEAEEIHELAPGHVASIKNDGKFRIEPFADPRPPTPCSFERIYFSRGNDPEIYRERKALGQALVPAVLQAVGNDLQNTIVSFVPNTAEIAYHGLMLGLREHRRHEVRDALLAAAQNGETLTPERIDQLVLFNWPRGEKIAHKDIKLRTFISQEQGRERLVSHVYDITYGEVSPSDNLVVIDDSIVRGTTLKMSILKMLARTNPKKIIIASTAPQIRYPDCYGIDMAEFSKFIAFEAAIALLRESGQHRVIGEVYDACLAELKKPRDEIRNCVKRIYSGFTEKQVSGKIAEFIYPTGTGWNGIVEVIYLGVPELHLAIPHHHGDWYFTGDYPTPGGYELVNRAFIAFCENKKGRVYDLV
ncbi:amidophosphoribosyltransferase [soil metagenome]